MKCNNILLFLVISKSAAYSTHLKGESPYRPFSLCPTGRCCPLQSLWLGLSVKLSAWNEIELALELFYLILNLFDCLFLGGLTVISTALFLIVDCFGQVHCRVASCRDDMIDWFPWNKMFLAPTHFQCLVQKHSTTKVQPNSYFTDQISPHEPFLWCNKWRTRAHINVYRCQW